MKSFWALFFHEIALGHVGVLSLISIAYTTKVISYSSPEDEIMSAISFGILGSPMVVASVIRFTNKFNEN